ncbi:MAG TPA: EVE domain-containing protein, partial [Pirellulaceae bacterium]|nr:EVE domain-containing protein [Pirellulaceae bacterium]
MKYWLVKTEPESFSIEDLAKAPQQTTCWEGVRNYQARNFMRDGMKLGDRVLFYHSNADPPAVMGVATVVREAYPDSFAWDKKSKYYDEKSTPENPVWLMVDLKLESVFPRPVSLDELRGVAALKEMELLRKGSRLSVQPVRKA